MTQTQCIPGRRESDMHHHAAALLYWLTVVTTFVLCAGRGTPAQKKRLLKGKFLSLGSRYLEHLSADSFRRSARLPCGVNSGTQPCRGLRQKQRKIEQVGTPVARLYAARSRQQRMRIKQKHEHLMRSRVSQWHMPRPVASCVPVGLHNRSHGQPLGRPPVSAVRLRVGCIIKLHRPFLSAAFIPIAILGTRSALPWTSPLSMQPKPATKLFVVEEQPAGPIGIVSGKPVDRRPYFRLRDDMCVELANVTRLWRSHRPEWVDYIEMEKASWSKGNATESQLTRDTLERWGADPIQKRTKGIVEDMRAIERGEKKLTYWDLFERQRALLRQDKMATGAPDAAPRRLPRLWIVQPKKKYCPLLEKDGPRLKSLVSRVRSVFRESELEIVRVSIEDRVPLCEVYVTGPVLHGMMVLYARGGTMQYVLPSQLRTSCPLLGRCSQLSTDFGGEGYVGGFPMWNEDNIFNTIVDSLRPSFEERHMIYHPDNTFHYDALNWITYMRVVPSAQHRMHYRLREACQRAFEDGVEDYREVLQQKYDLAMTEGKRYQQDSEDRAEELRRLHQDTWGQGYSLS